MCDYKELQVRGDRKKKTRLRMGGGQLHPISMLLCVVTRTLNYVPDYLHAVKDVSVEMKCISLSLKDQVKNILFICEY